MILNDEAFYMLREKRTQSDEQTHLIDNSSESDSESFKKYEKNLYKIPVVKNEELSSILKEIFFEYFTKCVLILLITIVALFIWIIWIDTALTSHSQGQQLNYKCDGINCQSKIVFFYILIVIFLFLNKFKCGRAKSFEITGNLCMDFCFTDLVKLPKCSSHLSYFSNSTYQFYSLSDSELNYICTPNLFDGIINKIPEGMLMDEFRQLVYDKVLANVNEPNTAEKIVDKIFLFTDVNNDLKVVKLGD